MTLDEAIEQIAARFPFVYGPPTSFAPTGEAYVTLMIGGVKPHGERPGVFCEDEDEAVRYWLFDFWRYAEGKNGTLYWREQPQIRIDDDLFRDESTMYGRGYKVFVPVHVVQVFSRLLISDRPHV